MEGFTQRNLRRLRDCRGRKTEKVVSRSDSSSNSEQDYEIEYIKDEFRKLRKNISDQFMNLKSSSRRLMSVDSTRPSMSLIFPACLEVKRENEIHIYPTVSVKNVLYESDQLDTLNSTMEKLKNRHKRASSQLETTLLQVSQVEQEQTELKIKLKDIQLKYITAKHKHVKNDCIIY